MMNQLKFVLFLYNFTINSINLINFVNLKDVRRGAICYKQIKRGGFKAQGGKQTGNYLILNYKYFKEAVSVYCYLFKLREKNNN